MIKIYTLGKNFKGWNVSYLGEKMGQWELSYVMKYMCPYQKRVCYPKYTLDKLLILVHEYINSRIYK